MLLSIRGCERLIMIVHMTRGDEIPSPKSGLRKLISKTLRSIRIFSPVISIHQRILARKARKKMGDRKFPYKGVPIPYFFHRTVYGNERIIEIPIAKNFIDTHEDILEVGNVLSHYFPVSHPVVDKYETDNYPYLVSEDICDFAPGRKYKNIVSVSTMEHVGFDEPEKDPKKFYKAMEKIKNLLDGGTFLMTVPWGYNPAVDEFIRSFKGDMTLYYRGGDEWKIGTLSDIEDKTYWLKYPYANALAVVEIR